MNRFLACTAAVAAMSVGTVTMAAVAVEDFNYNTGALGTANGGTGWQSSWGNTYGSDVVGGSAGASVVSGNLTNTANPYTPVGNSITIGGGTNFRKFSSTLRIARDSNDTLYFSMMVKPTAIGTSSGQVLQIKDTGNAFSHAEFGFNTSSQWALGGGYGGGGGGSGTTAAAGTGNAAFALNSQYFIVGKIVTSTSVNDRLWVKVYGAGDAVSLTDTLAIDNLLNFSVNRTGVTGATTLSLNTSGGGFSAGVDQLRIGDTYADVVVVPEPTSLAALGLAGLLGLRRRRA